MKQLFEESKLGALTVKNRLIRSATWEGVAAPDGGITDVAYDIYKELAKGGVGAIITGFTSVALNDYYFEGMMRLCDDRLIPQYKSLVDIIHTENCPVIAQLALGAYYRQLPNGSYRQVEPDDMTVEEIHAVIAQFGEAARRARERLSILLVLLLLFSSFSFGAFADGLTPGTYEGSAQSVGGPIRVSVTADESTITAIEILEFHDSEGVGSAAAKRLPEQMLEKQSTNVDGVTGATLSSLFIRNAVNDALSKAGDASAFSERAEWSAPAQADMEADVVVIGGGIAGMSVAATTAYGGLKTIVVEKNGFIGGNALISDQFCLAGMTDPVVSNWKGVWFFPC